MAMKSWLCTIIVVIIIAITSFISFQADRIKKLSGELERNRNNIEALISERDSIKNNNRVLFLTIEELNSLNDNISKELVKVSKELRNNNRKVQELQYQLSNIQKRDTIFLKDTIFKDPEFKLDTTLHDKWYSLELGLEYPSTIKVSPSFISERTTSVSKTKETVGPPKKCWLGRLFQKKREVVIVEVKENNPYIEITDQRTVKIIE